MSVAFLKLAKLIVTLWDVCYLNEPAERSTEFATRKTNSFAERCKILAGWKSEK